MVLTVKMRYSKFSYTRQEQTKNEESEEIMDDNLAKLIDIVENMNEEQTKELMDWVNAKYGDNK